jgi:hypothetical protein
MDVAYLSLRILDSLTKKSANNRTLSASDCAPASLPAKSRKRSMAAWQNWLAFCERTSCLVTWENTLSHGVNTDWDWELDMEWSRACARGEGLAVVSA